MNSEFAHWDVNKHQYSSKWGVHFPAAPQAPCPLPYAFPEQPFPQLADDFGQLQLGKTPKTRTTPVTTRTRITRHGSQPNPVRPSSSGGEATLTSYRPFVPPRRSESYSHPTPLEDFRNSRRWPPNGYRQDDALKPQEAEDLICAGASTFKGYWDVIPNAPAGYDRFYAVMESEHQSRTDRAPFQQQAYRDISLNMTGASDSQFPWLSQEQPCMAYAFGKSAGTTTLNFWVSKSGSSNPPTKFAGDAKPRKIKLLQILDRLQRLEDGLNEDDPEEMYRYLYSTLIEDPERFGDQRHVRIDQQIVDLITVLSNPKWIDFSLPKNQVVAKFFDAPDQHKKQEFFHQLLLSVELYLRIHSKDHTDKSKRKLIMQLPPIITWDLAVAQRWLENMEITKSRISSSQSTFSFDLKSKRRQKEALRFFAATLKWPNMDEIEYVLEEQDMDEKALEDRSADAMSWFSGIILPGRTLPWLIMNSLIDCDRDTGDSLKFLTHMQPASGFQYRANTYWSSQCIVGKVLGAARGVKQIAGWIGPCIYTPDLKRTECVKIKQHEALDPKLASSDVESMGERTNPLGPVEGSYPVDDYEVPMPDTEDVTDLIRMEKLSFVPAKGQPAATRHLPGAPMMFDAAIYFACGGESWPMKLRYDVDFINAFPCHQGPHVLFYDFAYKAIKIDDGLVDIHDWGRQSGRVSRPTSTRSSPGKKALALTNGHIKTAHEQVTNVLAIEALGVSDNEVFARAWCAHHGHSAIVANIKETCMACAIREAYAACVSVVILTEGGIVKENDTGIYGYI
ncbi:Nn.00g077140.m01.CDS01 [Neocucurbitaria sp. VM-36]